MSNSYQQPMYCYNHPKRETLLRCNQCERPICISCAVRTPTGYRCKECVRGQQKIFDTAQWWDFPLAALTGVVLAYLGSLLTSFIGFFTILLAPFAGMIIAEAVRRIVHKRRSKQLPLITAGAALFGALINPLFRLVLMILFSNQGAGAGILSSLFSFLWPAVFAVIVASTVYYRLKGIRV
jgi:hypothetical protein